jgi:peroxiredoxin
MNKLLPGSVYLFLLTVIIAGCKVHETPIKEGDIKLSGIIHGHQSSYLILEELTPSDIINQDTIHTNSDGSFYYTSFIKDAGFYRLRIPHTDETITIALDPRDAIYITATAPEIGSSYRVNGSEGSMVLWQLNQSIRAGLLQADSLRTRYHKALYIDSNNGSLKQEFKTLYKAVVDNQKHYALQLVRENQKSLAAILVLYQTFHDKQLINEFENIHYFESLGKSLSSVYPHNKHVINLKRRINDLKRESQEKLLNEKNLASGNPAPDISLANPQGKPVNLSSLKGNLVLVDFWAAWCPPCRDAHPKLRKLYQQYNAEGFEIYSISLDRTKEHWLNAIASDNMPWTHVSDLRFMNSPTVSMYNVVEVPHYVLIDREGRIIRRNINIQQLESLIKDNI